jgi:hypothetical protein
MRLKDAYLVRLFTGEEIVGAVAAFAWDQRIDAGSVAAVGSAYGVTLGYFDRATREYVRREIAGDLEIVSLLGTIALKEGKPFPHLHATLSDRECRAVAGHLLEARAAATCELVVRSLGGYVTRTKDEATGLFLLDL